MTKRFALLGLVAVLALIAAVYLLAGDSQKTTTTYDMNTENLRTAYFAGGCFWCVESDFEKFKGIKEVVSGYMGGDTENPTYKDHADHREAVAVHYEPETISYQDLVEYFFRHHDPTDEGGSFYDRGFAYTSAIYPQNDQEEQIAWTVIKDLGEKNVFENPIVTAVEADKEFWPAEDYHQDYYKKNPLRYKGYRFGSGRDRFIESVWGERDDFEVVPDSGEDTQGNEGEQNISEADTDAWESYAKPADEIIKQELSPLAFKVTQKEGTEPPRTEGNYDDNKEAGIYVDVLSGEPLFSSKDKYDSGTGWPSFTQPIDTDTIVTKTDRKLFFPRTEVRSKYGDNHLGHVFKDGPEPTGLRYCMNGVSMEFIALENMEEQGYGEYIDKVI